VRQIVQQSIPFQVRGGSVSDAVMELSSDSDGWVHLRTMSILPDVTASAQEWFAPDSVMAWARRVDSVMPAPGARDRGPRMIEHDISLGQASGIQYSVSFATLGKQVARAGTIVECNAGAEWAAPPVDEQVLKTFRAAARDARASRRTPSDAAATVHGADD